MRWTKLQISVSAGFFWSFCQLLLPGAHQNLWQSLGPQNLWLGVWPSCQALKCWTSSSKKHYIASTSNGTGWKTTSSFEDKIKFIEHLIHHGMVGSMIRYALIWHDMIWSYGAAWCYYIIWYATSFTDCILSKYMRETTYWIWMGAWSFCLDFGLFLPSSELFDTHPQVNVCVRGGFIGFSLHLRSESSLVVSSVNSFGETCLNVRLVSWLK